MAVKFKFTRYDFSNNLNVPEEEFQERRLEALLADGWTIEATDLTDVFLSVLWRRGEGEPVKDQRVAELEAERAEHLKLIEDLRTEASQRINQANQQIQQVHQQVQQLQAERDQARQMAQQLQARQADAPGSVQTGSTETP